MLKGKQGRFRQNLLGKRVDYSGRSVIVVGPELKLHQCGLPKKMALELFKPFIYARLDAKGHAATVKQAKKLVEKEKPEVWDILDEVIREHPVLLNRAPTLHRLGIQAFEPVLIEGKAIQLHPLVCAAFNADFDGDQMAVHVPLSLEAQLEARVLMMSTNNILHPANGSPIIVPSQDIVLGLYYLSIAMDKEPGEGMLFGNVAEIHHALEAKVVTLHTKIKGRFITVDAKGKPVSQIYDTTPGRMLLGELLPRSPLVPFELVNRLLTKKDISNTIDVVYRHCGQKETVIFCDRIMGLGFVYACRAGISFGKDDMVIPETKDAIVQKTSDLVREYEQQYNDGLITRGEKYNKVVDTWTECTELVAKEMMKRISAVERDPKTGREKPINSIYMMSHSGARGSPAQMKQLAGMRGLMTKPSGEIIETPIISNFKEGLSVLEYFNSTHGARKGLADTALKTANSGYLTRRLVDVAQDCIVTEEDCGTSEGITARAILEAGEVTVSLGQRVLGRTTCDNVKNPSTGKVVIKAGELIEEEQVEALEEARVQEVRIRSALTCETRNGICAKCYGRDLARGTPVNLGEAVGVIAAQSIGEPGTQLTMRTFHLGGVASAKVVDQSSLESNFDGTVKIKQRNVVKDSQGRLMVMGRNTAVVVLDEDGTERAVHRLPYGTHLRVDDGVKVKRGDRLAEWDPYTRPVLTEIEGTVDFEDLVEGVSVSERRDESTGITNSVIIDWRASPRGADLRPAMVIKDKKGKVGKLSRGGEARYLLPVDAILSVEPGHQVMAGDVLARIPMESAKTRDITGGLPRVAELFEARRPKDHAIIAEISGTVQLGRDYKNKRRITITPDDGRRAGRVSDPQGAAPCRAGGRSHREGRVPARRSSRAPRHPGHQGRRGAGQLSGQRDPGGLPAPGRDDQRQAYRGDRQADAAEDRNRGPRHHRVPQGRAGGPDRPRGCQRGGRGGRRQARHRTAGAARHHQGKLADPLVHLGGLVPGDHPRAHRCRRQRQVGRAGGPQGERDRRPADSGRYRRHVDPPEQDRHPSRRADPRGAAARRFGAAGPGRRRGGRGGGLGLKKSEIRSRKAGIGEERRALIQFPASGP